jgi:hypothetical protein
MPDAARSEGLEPPAYRFEACCSVQLSYERSASPVLAHHDVSANVARRGGPENWIELR